MATSSSLTLPVSVNCSFAPDSFDHGSKSNMSLSSAVKPMLRAFPRVPLQMEDPSKTMKNIRSKVLDAFVDSVFEFVDQPLLPSQRNFAPVEELGEAITISNCNIDGQIPDGFPEGVYIRNGLLCFYIYHIVSGPHSCF